MLIVKNITVEEWSLIRPWWIARKLTPPKEVFLPPTGLLISSGDTPLCAGFLFKTDAKIGIINHVISNPVPVQKKLRDDGIDFLIFKLCEKARQSGLIMVTAASNVPRMNERYEKMGFEQTDSNEVHYGRVL